MTAGPSPTVSVVMPCLDEALALRDLLPLVPAGWEVVVVDNGSTDGTAEVARGLGALVVAEPVPGYGSAVHTGVEAATGEILAVIDGDGSMDPRELQPMVDDVVAGRADLAVGRRVPTARGVWPWHARLGNNLVVQLLRRNGLPVHDIAPVRVCRRQALLDLGVEDRRFGYPVELMRRAVDAGWRFTERPIAYGPRAAGTRSKVSGSVRGTVRAARDFARVLR